MYLYKMVVDEKIQNKPGLYNGDALPSEIKTMVSI